MEKIINLHTHIHLNYRIMGEKKLNNNSSLMASPPPPPPKSLPQFVISHDRFDRNLNSTYLHVSIVIKPRL